MMRKPQIRCPNCIIYNTTKVKEKIVKIPDFEVSGEVTSVKK